MLENTAGGGSTLGTTFAEIAALLDEARIERLGLCLDTCHALAAGYEIRTPEGMRQTAPVVSSATLDGAPVTLAQSYNPATGALQWDLGDSQARLIPFPYRLYSASGMVQMPSWRSFPESKPKTIKPAI